MHVCTKPRNRKRRIRRREVKKKKVSVFSIGNEIRETVWIYTHTHAKCVCLSNEIWKMRSFCLFIFGKYKHGTSNLLPIISSTNKSSIVVMCLFFYFILILFFFLSVSLWVCTSDKIVRLKASSLRNVCMICVFDSIAKVSLQFAFISIFCSVTMFALNSPLNRHHHHHHHQHKIW